MNRFKSFSNYTKKCPNSLNIKVYLPEDDRIKTEAVKKDGMRSIEIFKSTNINSEKKQIQIIKSNAVRVEGNKPNRESIKICRNDERKELIIVTKKQEKIEIVMTPKSFEISKNKEMIINEENGTKAVTSLTEEKCEEFENFIRPEVENIKVEIDAPNEEKKKNPLNFVFNEVKQKIIEVKVAKKDIDNEVVPEPKIIANGGILILKEAKDMFRERKELMEDDPVIKMPEDLSCLERKVKKEEKVEELTCHGDAIGELKNSVDESMVDGDMSLKGKIIKDRGKNIEKKNTLEEFF
jgi:hypothetical protein